MQLVASAEWKGEERGARGIAKNRVGGPQRAERSS